MLPTDLAEPPVIPPVSVGTPYVNKAPAIAGVVVKARFDIAEVNVASVQSP